VALRLEELIHLSNDELAGLDVAETNLACARGLPGVTDADAERCVQRVGAMTEYAGRFTERALARFRVDPGEAESEAHFRALCLVTALQRDRGLYYDPAKMPADAPFGPADRFILGALLGDGGTCASLPVVYVAVGRRLGYPLKLVTACQHVFARWDDPGGERFNIECTSKGFVSHPDDHYLNWPHPLKLEQVQRWGALRSLTPRQELAEFLCLRGSCLEDAERYREAVWACANAHELDPEVLLRRKVLVDVMNRWDKHIEKRLVRGFPSMRIYFPPRRFPSLPVDLERGIVNMMTKENLLNDPGMERDFWAPLRQGWAPLRPLSHIEVRYPEAPGRPVDVILLGKQPAYFDPQKARPC
jgi:hypothetical protein